MRGAAEGSADGIAILKQEPQVFPRRKLGVSSLPFKLHRRNIYRQVNPKEYSNEHVSLSQPPKNINREVAPKEHLSLSQPPKNSTVHVGKFEDEHSNLPVFCSVQFLRQRFGKRDPFLWSDGTSGNDAV